jgi:aromatic-L-amino-acid decarboxylase
VARTGDLNPEEFREAASRVAEWVADYRERVEEFPVLARVAPGETSALLSTSAPENGEPLEAILDDLDQIILPGLTHWNHPGFLAYFASSSSAAGILAEFVIATLGVNAMLWRTSPAATELEERVIAWLRELLALPEAFEGVILDTASTSSFTALLAAREAAGVESRELGLAGRSDVPPLMLYVSDQAHSSLEKAAIAAGLGRRNLRRIATDDRYAMDARALARQLRSDLETGALPAMVCATVGTTSSNAVDPVERIADICAEAGVWLHVDAAYAGPAAMLPEKRELFDGWDRADSVVVNPHKWMATPMDCSVLLFRDREPFRASLALTPEYLSSAHEGAHDLMDVGLSLGRRFRGLKLWFLLRQLGATGLRALLRRHIGLAVEFADRIRRDSRFELAAPVPFGTVCFRALPCGARLNALEAPRNGDSDAEAANSSDRVSKELEASDEWNRELMARVNRRGPVFLSHTVLDGRYTLRLAVGSVHTEARHVEAAYRILCEEHDEMAGQGGSAIGEERMTTA